MPVHMGGMVAEHQGCTNSQQRSKHSYHLILIEVDDDHTERRYFWNPLMCDIPCLILLFSMSLFCYSIGFCIGDTQQFFGDTRLAIASYCKIWNRFPSNYGKQNCEWFVSAKLIISVSHIYCALIPGLSELPYLLLEIINHFIIVFIFSSFSFPRKLKQKNQFPLKM